jgi:hypothetical protein
VRLDSKDLNYIFYNNQYFSIHYRSGFKFKLVTVQPLTRGTGNHGGPTVSSSFSGGSSKPIVIENIIILDGPVIDKRIRKVALEDIGLQYSNIIKKNFIYFIIYNIFTKRIKKASMLAIAF